MTSNHPTNQTRRNLFTHDASFPFAPLSAYSPCSPTGPATTEFSGATAAATAAARPASLDPPISYTSLPRYGTFKDPAATSSKFRYLFRFLGRRKPAAKLDLESAGPPLLGLESQSVSESELEWRSRWERNQRYQMVVALTITEVVGITLIGQDYWISRILLGFVDCICLVLLCFLIFQR